jgi:hypothetical protein
MRKRNNRGMVNVTLLSAWSVLGATAAMGGVESAPSWHELAFFASLVFGVSVFSVGRRCVQSVRNVASRFRPHTTHAPVVTLGGSR